MHIGRSAWVGAVCFGLTALPSHGEAQRPLDDTLVITGATLVDGTGAAPLMNSVVVIESGRITTVGSALEVEIPTGAEVLDAAGRWLVPGFIDTHAHATLGPVELDMSGQLPTLSMETHPEIPARTLRALLAHGVTTMRDPGGDPAQLVALRDAVASGAILGPRMKVAGMVIDQSVFAGVVNQVSSADDVRDAVRADAEAGVDIAKLYVTLGPELLSAGISEAHAAGLDAVGHLHATTWTEAAQLGIDNILHIVPGSERLLPEARRADYQRMMARGTQFMHGWFQSADFDGPEIQEMIQALVENGVSVDPTLVIFEGMVRGNDPWYTEADALALAHPAMLANWQTLFTFNIGWTDADFREAQAAWPRFLELTRRLHEAGVTLSAGTDANNPWIIPGHSFHRELELLVDAGIPTLEVLTIATRNGAEVTGLLDEVGTVEEGKWADLVLLSADPVLDIANTRRIEWVMQAGRLFRPDDLLAGMR